MKDLSGKVVAITGAGSGMGREVAYELDRRGSRLALSDWDEDGLADTVSTVKSLGAEVRADRVDVSDRAAVLAWAEAVADQFGVVNVIVNNAGIAFTGTIEAMTFEEIERIMAVDFWGVVNGTKAFLPHVIASGDGHVVNISSLFGLMAVPSQGAYVSAKFAVRGFTETLREEMLVAGHPVGVTCVHPGGIKTAIARNGGAVAGEDPAELAEYFDKHMAKTSAAVAAQKIIAGIVGNRARVVIGPDAHVLHGLIRVGGSAYERLVAAAAKHSPAAKLRSERAGASR